MTTEDGRVRPKHVLIEYKKWTCYIDGQKNKYSVLNECNRMLKYNILYNILIEFGAPMKLDRSIKMCLNET
jgi:hypothetical protein